ncbi:MAG: methyltransferase domain-containing protein [Syntrophaceae bacterium]|nr:methyltransferase domain-containing protein [Syntrophaceae bacterium]
MKRSWNFEWFKTILQRNLTLNPFNDSNQTAWERRSKLYGTSLKGVLFKGAPDVVNEHFHDWHKKIVLEFVEGTGELRILDVGCGYGRLSIPIIEKVPNVDITGIDISENYVRLYKENTSHSAFVVGVEDLPPDFGTFDYILCVTVLMYLDDENLKKAVFNLLSHLKPKGKLILIEPHFSGYYFQTVFGLGTFLMKRIQKDIVDTQGRSFRSDKIEQLFHHAGGRVLCKWRLPMTSLFLGPLTLAGKLFPMGAVRPFCKFIFFLDALLGKLKLPSIQVAYLIAGDEKG